MASQKFKDLVHYIIWKCEDPSQLGATKLNKIPWFVDVIAFRFDGAPITGETYVKQERGPVPKNILPVLRALRAENKIAVREPMFRYDVREFVALSQPDMSGFSQKEVALFDTVIQAICANHTAGSISEASHDQIWDAAAIGEELPVRVTLAAAADEIVTGDTEWADSILNEIEVENRSAA